MNLKLSKLNLSIAMRKAIIGIPDDNTYIAEAATNTVRPADVGAIMRLRIELLITEIEKLNHTNNLLNASRSL